MPSINKRQKSKAVQAIISDPNTIHLDFGCGSEVRNPFGATKVISVDIVRHSEDIPTHVISRGERLPFPNNHFTSVSTFDVLEHLSRDSKWGNEFILYMREIYRVLKPGGLALCVFPAFPHKDAFSDPTHINFITDRTLDYFVGEKSENPYAGIDTEFEVVRNSPLRFWKRWIEESRMMNDQSMSLSLRRRLSLSKRTFFRIVRPQHRIWILRKPLV